MPVIIKVPMGFEKYSDNKKEITVKPGTLEDILTGLVLEYPGLYNKLFNRECDPKSYLFILYRGKILEREGFSRIIIEDGEMIKLLIPVSGG